MYQRLHYNKSIFCIYFESYPGHDSVTDTQTMMSQATDKKH